MTDDPFAIVKIFGIPMFSFIAAGAGAYIGSFLKKKGENLATKEDFDDLKNQTSELTAATKKIEMRISNEAWYRQQQWQLRRDLLYDLSREVGRLEEAFLTACETGEGPGDRTGDNRELWINKNKIGNAELSDVLKQIAALAFRSSMIGSDNLIAEVEEFHLFARELFTISVIGKASGELWFSDFHYRFKNRKNALTRSVRRELQITSDVEAEDRDHASIQ